MLLASIMLLLSHSIIIDKWLIGFNTFYRAFFHLHK